MIDSNIYLDLSAYIPIGDPNAFCFEPFFPWIYKIMLAYPSDQEKKDKKEGLPSRSLPTYYIENIN